MIPITPIHASQVILPRVWILAKRKAMTAATATNTAVQVAWVDNAFKAIDTLSIPEAATKIQTR